MTFTAGDLLLSRVGYNDPPEYPYPNAALLHLNASGALIETLTLPSGYDYAVAYGAALGIDGRLYVSYHGYDYDVSLQSVHNAVGRFDTTGAWWGDIKVWAAGGIYRPGGLSLTPSGDLLVHLRNSPDHDNITRLDYAGNVLDAFTTVEAGVGDPYGNFLNIPRVPDSATELYLYRVNPSTTPANQFQARRFDFTLGTSSTPVTLPYNPDTEGPWAFDAVAPTRVLQLSTFNDDGDERFSARTLNASLGALVTRGWYTIPVGASETRVPGITLSTDGGSAWSVTYTSGVTDADLQTRLWRISLGTGAWSLVATYGGLPQAVFAALGEVAPVVRSGHAQVMYLA